MFDSSLVINENGYRPLFSWTRRSLTLRETQLAGYTTCTQRLNFQVNFLFPSSISLLMPAENATREVVVDQEESTRHRNSVFNILRNEVKPSDKLPFLFPLLQ